MKERRWLFFIISAVSGCLIAYAAGFFQSRSTATIVLLTIIVLAGVRLLVSLSAKNRVVLMITSILPCFGLLFGNIEVTLPLIAVCLTDFFQEIIPDRRRIPVLLCIIAILAAILHSQPYIVLMSFAMAGVVLYILDLIDRKQNVFAILIERNEKLAELEMRLGGQRRVAQSMEHTAKIAERSRLAMRLHDEVGHGISGNILLLEGAMTVIDTDVDVAKDTIVRATENLRASADEIRKVLREEYAEKGEAGIARLKNELAHFGNEHPAITTKLINSGDMENIPSHLWSCICENMTEAMINTIKHSRADLFCTEIEIKNKLLRVVFSDNGGMCKSSKASTHEKIDSLEVLNQGIGLSGIEERCALCFGRCFFENRPDGFYITMTFPLRRSA